MIDFIVPGPPQSKARPRVVNGHAYTPQKTVDYENTVRQAWMAAGKPRIEDGKAITVSIVAYFPIPKSTSKKRREEWDRLCKYHTHKPDADNVAKAVLDALNGLAYKDDSAIANLSVTKVYSEDPHVYVMILPIQREYMLDDWRDME